MNTRLTIGAVARETGISPRTIRFYEAEGALPPPARTTSGYRSYSANDIRRLRLLRQARLLGLSLNEAGLFVAQAFSSDCCSFAPQLIERITTRRAAVRARIAELRAIERDLVALEHHVAHAECATRDGQRVENCDYCPMIDDEGGRCDSTECR